MAIVEFSQQEFKDIYPQYIDFNDAQLQFAFEVACLVVDNSEQSKVPYNPPEVKTRKTSLYLLVCHLCELKIRNIVGAITSATEGSVSATFAVPTDPSGGWFNQTQCGATAWQLLSGYTLGGRLYNGCFR